MRKKIITVLTFTLGLILVYSPFAFVWQTQAAGTITGRVYQDFNGNGSYDTTTTVPNSGSGTIGAAIDRGIQNARVIAYNSAGTNVTTGTNVVTAADGTYTLTTSDAGSGPYRIEFTNLPAGYWLARRNVSRHCGHDRRCRRQ